MGVKNVISDEEALRIRRQWEREVLPKVERDQQIFEATRAFFQRVSEGRIEAGELEVVQHAARNVWYHPKHDLAEKRRLEMEQYFRARGFPALVVPKLNVPNREFGRRAKLGQQLFFNHFKTQADYDVFMTAVGQETHWTVTDEKERLKIGWEFSKEGYWFWTEVAPCCPRLETTWNTLVTQIFLLSLEEEMIVWDATKAETRVAIDIFTWNWLRTRFNGSGAMRASGYDGRVCVCGIDGWDLSVPFGNCGGRLAEVVQN